MGSAGTKLFQKKQLKLLFVESSKASTAKDEDTRRRNSLAYFLRDWQGQTTFEEQEASMIQIKRYRQLEAKVETDEDPIMVRLNKPPREIALGNMRVLRDTVILRWKDINRSYQGSLLGDTVLHTICREGYLEALKFVVDPNTKSVLETERVDPNIVNKRKRTALMLCFTSPQFTKVAQKYGLQEDPAIGLAVPRAERPETAQTNHDWMKPGGRADREEMIRILVEDLDADVKVLDMHEYSLLHYAAISGWGGTTSLLLSRGANPFQTCATGETALHFAVSLRHGEAAEVLLKHCPSLVNETDEDGDRAIHMAVQNGDVQVVRLLVHHGADMNSPNYRAISPLAVACKRQDCVMVNLLLDLKVARDEDAFVLLEGEARDKIQGRLKREEKEQLKLSSQDEGSADSGKRSGVKAAYGQWVPYSDKIGGGIFYYNKVSRESRREMPQDYQKDKTRITKRATFGMHFYH